MSMVVRALLLQKDLNFTDALLMGDRNVKNASVNLIPKSMALYLLWCRLRKDAIASHDDKL